MRQELINVYARIGLYWVENAQLGPEIPRRSLAFVVPVQKFVSDGIYVLNCERSPGLYRCSGLDSIAVSHNGPLSLAALDTKEFEKIVAGRVIGHMKIWE